LIFDEEVASQTCEKLLGYKLKDKQLTITECISKNRDCFLIAGCGWGKSLAFFIPLLLWKDRSMLIITPLKAIMEQHKKVTHKTTSTSTWAVNKVRTMRYTYTSHCPRLCRG